MPKHRKWSGSVLDLQTVIALEAFFDVLRAFPPTLTVPFLHKTAAWEASEPLVRRMQHFRLRAMKVFPNSKQQEQWAQYLMMRMVPFAAFALYAQDPSAIDALYPLKGMPLLQEVQARYGAAVLVGSHWAEYLCIPLVLAHHNLSVVVPVDQRTVEYLSTLKARYVPSHERIQLISVPGPTPWQDAILSAVDRGYWPLWFADLWYESGTSEATALQWFAALARDRRLPILPVTACLGEDGMTVTTVVDGPVDTPKLTGGEAGSVLRVQAWIQENIERDPTRWWGWAARDTLPFSED